MDEVRLLPRLLVALALGMALGIERERRDKPAGLRTHVVVCLSTATLMAAAELLQTADGATLGDPTRMAQGILTGIGFLGAGAIIRDGGSVTGITTAATIWLVAVVGLLAGSGLFIFAAALTLAALVVLAGMQWLERRLNRESGVSDAELERGRDD